MVITKEVLEVEEFFMQVFVPTNDEYLNSVFGNRQERAGLQGLDVSLLVPEEFSYDNGTLGSACGSKKEGYSVSLCPANIESQSLVSYVHVMDHELAHIKNGDCDRKVSSCLRWVDGFFSELRAYCRGFVGY